MMTRKDYIKTAEIIRKVYNYECGKATALEILAEEFAMYFENDNPNFNSEIFFNACGLEFLALSELGD